MKIQHLRIKLFISVKVCFIGEPKYHYIKRDNSMMDQYVKEIKIDSVLIFDGKLFL